MSDKVKGTVGQILLKKHFEKQFRSVSVTAHKWINVKKIKNISNKSIWYFIKIYNYFWSIDIYIAMYNGVSSSLLVRMRKRNIYRAVEDSSEQVRLRYMFLHFSHLIIIQSFLNIQIYYCKNVFCILFSFWILSQE